MPTTLSGLLRRHPGVNHLSLIEAIEVTTPSNTSIYHNYDAWPNSASGAEQLVEDMRALALERLHLAGIEVFDFNCSIAGSENHDLHLSRILDYNQHGYGGNPMTLAGFEECMEMDEDFWESHSWDVWNREFATKERKELVLWKGYLPWWQLRAVKAARDAREVERRAQYI